LGHLFLFRRELLYGGSKLIDALPHDRKLKRHGPELLR
jgi:hypothetical protein